MKPTLYITNWTSPKLHGPGRKWTIMAAPRAWEHGDGAILAFVPDVCDLYLARRGVIGMDEYRRRFVRHVGDWGGGGLPGDLVPGRLVARMDGCAVDVADGDTLLCACAKAAASRGECHRVWGAELLRDAGWRIMLDGTELPNPQHGAGEGDRLPVAGPVAPDE